MTLEPGWSRALARELDSSEMRSVATELLEEQARGVAVYPPPGAIFAAFDHTPFGQVRAVIVGQDPYHGPGQAMGLAFSVPRGERVPPSLRNLYRELESDLGITPAEHGDLTAWADRGVLLLNTSLTVRAHEAGSHVGIGWQSFTAAALRALSEQREHLVFMLWGRHAQERLPLIDQTRHLVLQSAHPSPLSARRGFFGSRPFSQANAYLESHAVTPIDWSLPR
ncbi:MAG: uracil-DNA glycosylase [Thermoleophilia bacterium]|nr:uracil-DNA glycosylase [Thermoleophilia bacterium]